MASHPFIVQAMVKGDIEAASNLGTLEGANINQRRAGTLAYISVNGQNHINVQEQFLVKTGHPAKSLKDLKGPKLLSAPGPANIGAARAVLKAVGLGEGNDFTIQEPPMGVHLAALPADAAHPARHARPPPAGPGAPRGATRRRLTMGTEFAAEDVGDCEEFGDMGVEQKIVAGARDGKRSLKRY